MLKYVYSAVGQNAVSGSKLIYLTFCRCGGQKKPDCLSSCERMDGYASLCECAYMAICNKYLTHGLFMALTGMKTTSSRT